MERLANLVSNAASQHVRPSINPITENLSHPDGMVMVVTISKGISKPYIRLPAFIVKCITCSGTDIHDNIYIDSQDITGIIKKVFVGTIDFILRNLRRIQKGQNVNSLSRTWLGYAERLKLIPIFNLKMIMMVICLSVLLPGQFKTKNL